MLKTQVVGCCFGIPFGCGTLLLQDGCVRLRLRALRQPAALVLGCEPDPADAVRHRQHEKGARNQRANDPKGSAELLSERGIFDDFGCGQHGALSDVGRTWTARQGEREPASPSCALGLRVRSVSRAADDSPADRPARWTGAPCACWFRRQSQIRAAGHNSADDPGRLVLLTTREQSVQYNCRRALEP